METSTGKGTGDGLRHPAGCCKAGYQSQGLPQGQTYRSPDWPWTGGFTERCEAFRFQKKRTFSRSTSFILPQI